MLCSAGFLSIIPRILGFFSFSFERCIRFLNALNKAIFSRLYIPLFYQKFLNKLIKTHRIKTGDVQKRLYSQYDVEWLQCVRILVKKHKMSISSIKILLQILFINPKTKLPNNEIGEVLGEMTQNPNFKLIVKDF